MTKEYNRLYEYITSTECYGGFPMVEMVSYCVKAHA
jgi:hypothetical protein